MLDLLSKIFKDCFTQSDNQTYCAVRILGAISLFHYLILSNIELVRACKDFSLIDMATGVSILIGVISAGISLKNKTD